MNMSNVFNINRFGNILAKELKEYYSKYGISILSILGAYVIYWLIVLLFGDAQMPSDRASFFMLLFLVAIYLAPLKLYGDVNNNNSGIFYAMTPASTLEKFISMLINTLIVTPIVFILLFSALDGLLTLISFGGKGFQEFSLSTLVFNRTMIYYVVGTTLSVSYFIFGNLFFKRHKGAKTILSAFAINFVLIIIAGLFINYVIPIQSIFVDGKESISIFSQEDLIPYREMLTTLGEVLLNLYLYGLPVVLLLLSYFRLKTIKYQ